MYWNSQSIVLTRENGHAGNTGRLSKRIVAAPRDQRDWLDQNAASPQALAHKEHGTILRHDVDGHSSAMIQTGARTRQVHREGCFVETNVNSNL